MAKNYGSTLALFKIKTNSVQLLRINNSKKKRNNKRQGASKANKANVKADYPRHTLIDALRIPKAILEQNAGKACTVEKAASYVGINYSGSFGVEISSATKYKFLERPGSGQVKVTELAKKIIRPQKPNDEIEGLREAFLKAPDFSKVYMHYRGENLPDDKFFYNALLDNFNLPDDKIGEFKGLFIESLKQAELLEQHENKYRVIDVTHEDTQIIDSPEHVKNLIKEAKVTADDSCFVMMPFSEPIGNYYSKIYKPAVQKAGLTPIRADTEIFGTGKIMDQIWKGINSAKVLVSELTTRNPNVFYELGLAHALNKPVILVSRNEEDVPFDLQHIRVIYYDVNDPFWGEKLIDKIAENILSALNNPEEALFKRVLSETR
ncbi:MAG: hypothetical protein AAF632_22610 [Bacteroidota bacterium]